MDQYYTGFGLGYGGGYGGVPYGGMPFGMPYGAFGQTYGAGFGMPYGAFGQTYGAGFGMPYGGMPYGAGNLGFGMPIPYQGATQQQQPAGEGTWEWTYPGYWAFVPTGAAASEQPAAPAPLKSAAPQLPSAPQTPMTAPTPKSAAANTTGQGRSAPTYSAAAHQPAFDANGNYQYPSQRQQTGLSSGWQPSVSGQAQNSYATPTGGNFELNQQGAENLYYGRNAPTSAEVANLR